MVETVVLLTLRHKIIFNYLQSSMGPLIVSEMGQGCASPELGEIPSRQRPRVAPSPYLPAPKPLRPSATALTQRPRQACLSSTRLGSSLATEAWCHLLPPRLPCILVPSLLPSSPDPAVLVCLLWIFLLVCVLAKCLLLLCVHVFLIYVNEAAL